MVGGSKNKHIWLETRLQNCFLNKLTRISVKITTDILYVCRDISRKNVRDVNYLFKNVMSKSTAELDYTEDERLKAAQIIRKLKIPQIIKQS